MKLRSRLSRGALVAMALAMLTGVGIVGYLELRLPAVGGGVHDVADADHGRVFPGGHLSTAGLVFTAGLAFLGVGLFFVILALAAAAIVEGRVSLFSRSRRMRSRLDQLHGHFIVCAYGRVGRAVAAELAAGHVPFVVVDSNARAEGGSGPGGPVLPDRRRLGRGGTPEGRDRTRPGTDLCGRLGCGDVFITIVARSLSQDLLIVARAAPQLAVRLYRAGATHVVSPYATSGRRMANLAVGPHVVKFFDVARAGHHDLRLEELAITRVPAGGPDHQGTARPAVPLLVRHPNGQLVASPARPAPAGRRRAGHLR